MPRCLIFMYIPIGPTANFPQGAGEGGERSWALRPCPHRSRHPERPAGTGGCRKGILPSIYGGIEISCRQQDGRQLHLLAYQIPPEGRRAVEEFCRPIRLARKEALLKSIRRLRSAGYPITEEQVRALAGPSGELVQAVYHAVFIDAGLCTELYGPHYRHLFKTQPDGSPGIATLSFLLQFLESRPPRGFGWREGRAGHPGQYGNFAGLPGLKEAGLWGVEASHPKHCRKIRSSASGWQPVWPGPYRRLRFSRPLRRGEAWRLRHRTRPLFLLIPRFSCSAVPAKKAQVAFLIKRGGRRTARLD